jgi:hypothetical protein
MESTAFITLEDISDQLPSYEETVLSVDMDPALSKAYEVIEKEITEAMKAHRGNKSLMSVMLNTLLLYPDHPHGIGAIWGKQYDPQQGGMVPFFVTEPEDLPETDTYAKEQRLIGDIREELRQGRRCQVYATFTGKHDVTARLERVLQQAGFRVAVLRSTVATDKREAWYERQLRAGVQVTRSARLSNPLLLRNGILAPHSPAGKPALVADWASVPGPGEISGLSRHDAGDLHPSHGQEDASRADDGREVLRRRAAIARCQRGSPDCDGS